MEQEPLKLNSAIPFNPKELNIKQDNFMCNALVDETEPHKVHKQLNEFTRELEDLMRKHKIVQVVAQIFAKL